MSAPCCIAYNPDPAYLFPTFVSAMQARRHVSAEKADVYLFAVGVDRKTMDAFAPACERENLHLVSVPVDALEGQNAMLARLFLNRYAPSRYTQYLYLDGDTQILGSLDPLIDADVPDGTFLAANDPSCFLLEDDDIQSRDLARHFASIGLTREQTLRYFNSGVLRIARKGWDEIGMGALRYCLGIDGPSRFPDQDALNLVGVDSHQPMSLAWNFPVFLRNVRLEAAIRPRIVHFMSSPKPWLGNFPPWNAAACKPYAEALGKYPELTPYRATMPLRKQAVYHAQQRVKKALETFTWGLSERRNRVLRYEEQCARLAVHTV